MTKALFHLRSIGRHTKSLVKHMLGLTKPITDEEVARSTASWHRTEPDHPIELCKCVCGPEAPDEEHSENCPWVAARCRTCTGGGYCPGCHGDGLQGTSGVKRLPEEWEHA